VLTVTSRNLVHAALFLATTLAGIAGVFLVCTPTSSALVQLIVYVGAVAVLFLFGLMLTRAPIGREALDSQNRRAGPRGRRDPVRRARWADRQEFAGAPASRSRPGRSPTSASRCSRSGCCRSSCCRCSCSRR
jgi:hypothetical protein